jgi:ABC-type transport system substrate-binding protein
MTPIKFDPAASKKLLSDAGYPNGKGLPQLKFYITGNMTEVEFIVDQWKKNLGVDVKIEILESGVYWNQVWASWTPNLDSGFTRINCPMNSFEIQTLDKNAFTTDLWYDYPAKVRKQDNAWEEERTAFLTKDGGTKDADWVSMLDLKAKLSIINKEMPKKEPNAKWVEEMTRKPIFEEQFNEVYDNWKKATTDKDKTEQWRLANRILLREQQVQLEYKGMNDTNKQARRLRYDMTYSQFDKAIEIAPKMMQIIQDTYFMVPLYTEKAQYIAKPNLSGIMVYKFSWGPAIFNLKYLNVK